ncbi:MAG TPA: tail fiber domain-containing protein, partial [Ktedonobacteraceae bacterium]
GISVPLIGGTMTGPLILNADPTNVKGAATKQYVDARVGGTGYLLLSGGTLTGFLTLNADPTALLHAATKQYVDGHITSAVAGYLPLTGGTLTGSLALGANNVTANGFVLNTGGGNFFANSTVAYVIWDSANYRLQYTRATGSLQYLRGTDSAQLWLVDASGNETVTGQISCGGNVVSSQSGYYRGGTVFFGSADRSYLATDSATSTTLMFHNSGYQLAWAWSDAVWRFYNSSNAICFAIGPTGAASCSGNFSSNAAIVAGTNLQATNAVFANNSTMMFGPSSGNAIIQMASNWYWQWLTASGTMLWVAFGTQMWTMRQSDFLCWNNAGTVGGFGAYQNLSDERVKTAITEAKYGLPEILQINPITFKRIPRSERREEMAEEVGFSAQQLKPILPHAVVERVIDEEDLMFIDSDVIIAALVNAVKTLEQRISAMESR